MGASELGKHISAAVGIYLQNFKKKKEYKLGRNGAKGRIS